MSKITGIDNKTRDTEIEIIHSKKVLNQLERSLKEMELKRMQEELLKNQDQPVFFTEFEEQNTNTNGNNDHQHNDDKNEKKNKDKNNDKKVEESSSHNLKYERNKT